MESEKIPILPKRNPETEAAFRRHVGLQVLLPLGVMLVLVLAFLIVFWPASAAAKSAYADISLVLIIIPALVMGIVMLVVIGGMIYLIMQTLRVIPGAAYQVQDSIDRVARYVRLGADKAALPFVRASAAGRALRALGTIFTRNEVDEHGR